MQRMPWHVADNCLTVDGLGASVHGPELLGQHRLRLGGRRSGRILALAVRFSMDASEQ